MITLQNRFLVRAPIDAVWDFLMDPRRVVSCMPGAQLDTVESDRVFTGSIQVAFGPFKTSYKGRVEFIEVHEAERHVRMAAEGHEAGAGAARGWMASSLTEVAEGTEAFVDLSVAGTSRLMNHGLRLGQHLAHELFGQFVARLKEQLESPEGAKVPVHADRARGSVQVVPLLARAFARRFRALGATE
jgi:carbon monoxide dehydrogenase subunit G